MLHLLLALSLESPMLVAGDSRCNDVNVGAIEQRLQRIAANPKAGGSPAGRGAAILAAQADAGEEQVILSSVCPEADYRPLGARLFVLDAWADLLAYTNAPPAPDCPDLPKKVEASAVASAWLSLGRAAGADPKPAKLEPPVEALARSLAAEAGVTLPAFADATTYWASSYQQAGREAIAACNK